MKVIKHGNTVKELTCPICGCIFTAAQIDVSNSVCWSKSARVVVDRFFNCPECGHECGREDITE